MKTITKQDYKKIYKDFKSYVNNENGATKSIPVEITSNTEDITIKLKKLLKAKENVAWLLSNPDSSVDFHGLSYWAGVVETLREEVKI